MSTDYAFQKRLEELREDFQAEKHRPLTNEEEKWLELSEQLLREQSPKPPDAAS
jgi:hypothetical protein